MRSWRWRHFRYYSLAEVHAGAARAKWLQRSADFLRPLTSFSASTSRHPTMPTIHLWSCCLGIPAQRSYDHRWLSVSLPELDAYFGSCGHMPFCRIAMFMALDAKYPDQQIRPFSENRRCQVEFVACGLALEDEGEAPQRGWQAKASCRLLPSR